MNSAIDVSLVTLPLGDNPQGNTNRVRIVTITRPGEHTPEVKETYHAVSPYIG